MGNLLNILLKDDHCCLFPGTKYDIFVDFENAQPQEEVAGLYSELETLLSTSANIIETIKGYKCAFDLVKMAIAEPTPTNELRAWEALMPLVKKIKVCYDHSIDVNKAVTKILEVLCSGTKKSVVEVLDTHQALVKQLAHILEFVFEFDECKMKNALLQNDFSYYNRTGQRIRSLTTEGDPCRGIDKDNQEFVDARNKLVNYAKEMDRVILSTHKMSFFVANSNPMLHSISEATIDYLKKSGNSEIAKEVLCVFAKVCQRMLTTPDLNSRIQSKETELFVLRVMVAIIILYDHVDPIGAFDKKSGVDAKGCIKVLVSHPLVEESLLQAIKFTTLHFRDETTPKSTRMLIEDAALPSVET